VFQSLSIHNKQQSWKYPAPINKQVKNHTVVTVFGQFHFRRASFSQQIKSKVGLALAQAAALRINLNLDGTPIESKTHTHPVHSSTSRLLTSSLSLGVPVPRPTQCMRGA
jgi:hypothetical protein